MAASLDKHQRKPRHIFKKGVNKKPKKQKLKADVKQRPICDVSEPRNERLTGGEEVLQITTGGPHGSSRTKVPNNCTNVTRATASAPQVMQVAASPLCRKHALEYRILIDDLEKRRKEQNQELRRYARQFLELMACLHCLSMLLIVLLVYTLAQYLIDHIQK